ncbi:MAG: hypothetical protein U1F46_02660 [Marinagarivorans sp.]
MRRYFLLKQMGLATVAATLLASCEGNGYYQMMVQFDSQTMWQLNANGENKLSVWRYQADNKTIAQYYTPDSQGRVYINSATNTVSWGWAGRIVNTAYPGGITYIFTHFNETTRPERAAITQEEALAISQARTLREGIAFETLEDLNDVSVQDVRTTADSAPPRDYGPIILKDFPSNTNKITLSAGGQELAIANPKANSTSVAIARISTAYIGVSAVAFDDQGKKIAFAQATLPYLAQDDMKGLSLSVNNPYVSTPWQFNPKEGAGTNGTLAVTSNFWGDIGITRIDGDASGFIELAATTTADNYSLNYSYQQGVSLCYFTQELGSSLPNPIEINRPNIAIMDAKNDPLKGVISWQPEPHFKADLFILMAQRNTTWLATTKNDQNTWQIPDVPSEFLQLTKAQIMDEASLSTIAVDNHAMPAQLGLYSTPQCLAKTSN